MSINPSFELAGTQHTVRAGEVIFRRGQDGNCVCHVDAGRVGLGLLDGDRLEHQLGLVQGPSWLDVGPALLQKTTMLDAVAQSEVVLRRVDVAEFRRAFGQLPLGAQVIMHDMALAHQRQTELAVSRLVKDAQSRCAEWLVRHAQPVAAGESVVALTQRKCAIAAQLGIAPETFSRVLRQLRERGLIAGTGRTLKVLEPKALRVMAQA